jgi:hypothetical protein
MAARPPAAEAWTFGGFLDPPLARSLRLAWFSVWIKPFTLRIPVVAPIPDEIHLKQALKAALIEVLEERSDLLRDVIAEVFEDVAFAHAIREGETSEEVSREEVLRILDSPE